MGVSGAGKTTVGRALARDLCWRFVDADDFHPAANVAKMERGEPLDDRDREPWLTRLAELLREHIARGESLVLACSALKASHRARLRVDPVAVRFVHLRATVELLRERLAGRRGHFFDPALLQSQLDALEPPEDALVVDAARQVDDLVGELRGRLGLDGPGSAR